MLSESKTERDKYKPLSSTLRRRRADIREKNWEKKRQAFVDVWCINKTSQEILNELGKSYTPKTQNWLTKRASQLRNMGYDVPSRVVDGKTPSQRRDIGFAKFWNQISKRKYTRYAKRTSYLDFELLKEINAKGRTTEELLECYDCSRTTLLKRLTALEKEGYISRSLQHYNGRGRGYLWKLAWLSDHVVR